MSLKELVRRHRGQRDERIVAEMNKIYRGGFFSLTLGVIIYLYYSLMRRQIALFNDIDSVPYLDFGEAFLYGWFMVTMIVCVIVQIRKGFMDDGRYAETDYFPAGYFALISLGAGLGTGVLAMLMRALAEWELLGAVQVNWLVDALIGISIAISVFVACFVAFYGAFLAARQRRRKTNECLED